MAQFEVAPIKSTISIDDLDRIDVRVGTIEKVRDVLGADKLVKLVVSFGDRQRNILAGLKQEREELESLVGCQALFVVNLEPRRMKAELSEGTLFDIGYADGIRPRLAVPEDSVPDGSPTG